MNDTVTTSQMNVHRNDIISMLSPGAIRAMAMVSNRCGDETLAPSVEMDTSSDSLVSLYTVLTYPFAVIPSPRTNRGPGRSNRSESRDFLIFDGEHYVRVKILDDKSLNEPIEDLSETANFATFYDFMKAHSVVIRIKSYVTSLANATQTEPEIYVTGMETGQHRALKFNLRKQNEFDKAASNFIVSRSDNVLALGKPFPCMKGIVVGGKFADFLTNIAMSLSCETLSGCQENSTKPTLCDPICSHTPHNTNSTKVKNKVISRGNKIDTIDDEYAKASLQLELISSFLLRHQAIRNIAMLSEEEGHEVLVELPSSISLHMSVLASFCKFQMERQKTSMRTEPSHIAEKIIKQYHDVLQEVYDDKIPLINHSTIGSDIHIDTLHYCHSKLCRDLIPDGGQFRTKLVRVSTTKFAYDGRIEETVSRLLLALQNLRTRIIENFQSAPTTTDRRLSTGSSSKNVSCGIFTKNTPHISIDPPQILNQCGQQATLILFQSKNDRSLNQRRVLATITYAAAVCMGILDTHPYSDGNGRLARILLNFVLYQHLRLPFPIALFSTPEQRFEYTKAICKTRQNTDLLPVGDVPNIFLLEAYKHAGALRPIVDLILDRLHKSITEFNKQIIQKENAQLEEVSLESVRNAREHARNTGVCQICLDIHPDISILCCGTVYHMNCIAQWLKNNTTCPQCRSDTPRLQAAIGRVISSNDDDDDDSDVYGSNDFDFDAFGFRSENFRRHSEYNNGHDHDSW